MDTTEQTTKKKGLFRRMGARLKQGLQKTRQKISSGVKSLVLQFSGRWSDDLRDELEGVLLQADLGVSTTEDLLEAMEWKFRGKEVTAGDVLRFIGDALKEQLGGEVEGVAVAESGPTVVLVVGVNGSGKTTSIAKLAHRFKADGKQVVLAASDTFRAAAVDQLAIWAERIGVSLVRRETGADPAAVAYEGCEKALRENADVLIVDTAGRLHTNRNLMRELSKIKSVLGKRIPGAPHEVILVLDATTGQNAVVQAREFRAATEVSGLFLAKLDGTARGGVVVRIHKEIGIPVKFVGLGETPEDIAPFNPATFVDALFTTGEEG